MADYEKIRTEFTGHRYITVEPMSGNPPERYRITYKIKGLRLDPALNRPAITNIHRAEIYLHNDYPREKPKCVMLTEIFHPNFGPYICIGDHWAAGETLADVIVQIGQMIQYQSYNPKSPLNGVAAMWAQQNEQMLPVGNVDLYQPEPEISFGDEPAAEDDLDITLGPSGDSDDEDFDVQLQ